MNQVSNNILRTRHLKRLIEFIIIFKPLVQSSHEPVISPSLFIRED